MQAQQRKPIHGKPSRANPPTASPQQAQQSKPTHPRILKKKKKKTNRKSETYPLYHGHVASEITEKINPKDYNQSKIKTYQKAKAIYCVSKFCTKKKPQYRLCTKTEKIKNPIVVVAVAKLARRCRRLAIARRSSQKE